MACGENPKRVYGGQARAPMHAHGQRRRLSPGVRGRAGLPRAVEQVRARRRRVSEEARGQSKDKKDGDEADEPPTPPKRDLKLETLVGAMNGDIHVHIHCYRADEMAIMLDLSKEFGFKIAAFHHAVEAYKIADLLAANGVCGAEWADWWGFKMELFDGIQENIALTDLPQGGCAIVHSDSDEGIQRLNQEAAQGDVARQARRARASRPSARSAGSPRIPRARSASISRPARSSPARWRDVVIWNGTPFSVYALAEQVFVDGALAFDRANPPPQAEVGLPAWSAGRGSAAMRTLVAIALLSCAALGERAGRADPRRHGSHRRRARRAEQCRRAGSRRQDRRGRHRPRARRPASRPSMRRAARSRPGCSAACPRSGSKKSASSRPPSTPP